MHGTLMLISTSAASLALTLSSPAAALVPQVDPPLKPIDPNVGDVNPLSTSFRDTRVDLRQPLGFTSVYRVPGQPGMLMRSSGAVYAVFPNSEYVRSPIGPLAKVPSGTVFYIGLPPTVSSEAQLSPENDANSARVSSRIDSRVDTYSDSRVESYVPSRLGSDHSADSPYVAGVTSRSSSRLARDDNAAHSDITVANNEEFRIRRLGELLERAREAVTNARKTAPEVSVAEARGDQR